MQNYVFRSNQAVIEASMATPFVTALLGPRRVGKSTFVQQYAKGRPTLTWVFLNMDSLDERRRIEAGQLRAMVEEAALQKIGGGGSAIWVVVDEAQKCPALFEQVKLIYDEYKDMSSVKFILTGSGLLTLHQLSAESLAGRIQIYYLREFNVREAAQLTLPHRELPRGSILDTVFDSEEPIHHLPSQLEELAPFRSVLNAALQSEFAWGGLPEVLEMSEAKQRLLYLANYLQTYLEKDVRALATIQDLHLYRHLLEIMAEQTGSLKDDKRILEALSCSRDTLKKYRGLLQATLSYQEIYPLIGRTLKRLVKSPKGYLTNNGLISYLTSIDEYSVLEKTGLVGARMENWFLKELQIALDRNLRKNEICFWRTAAGVEVDFVVRVGQRLLPFEVTCSAQKQTKKVKHLLQFMQEEQVSLGFYVYTGAWHYDKKNGIVFLPAWAVS